jgi:hypothetical protein
MGGKTGTMNIQFGRIEKWPGRPTPNHLRQRSRFDTPFSKTVEQLKEELRRINARDVVIQTTFHSMQFSPRTGWPYADAEPETPQVILSFTSPKNGPLSFPCDTYEAFDCNLRAIVLALEALRAVDRYGVTRNAEQYAGWKKLAAPVESHLFNTAEDAEAFINENGGTYRAAAAKLHPDNKETGSHDLFVKLQAAMAMLEAKAS